LLFIAVTVYAGVVVVLPLTLPKPMLSWAFSETGPFEIGALILWIVAAGVLIVRIRPFTSRTLAFATIFLLFAAREADLQKAFTSESILKLAYYRHSADPLLGKIIAGVVALLFVTLAAYALFVSVRFLLREGGLKSRSGMWLAIAWTVLVFTKIVDRSKDWLMQKLGVTLPPGIELLTPALEEGFEVLVPFLFIVSARIHQVERDYLCRNVFDGLLGPLREGEDGHGPEAKRAGQVGPTVVAAEQARVPVQDATARDGNAG
jgi:hypothetical protein